MRNQGYATRDEAIHQFIDIPLEACGVGREEYDIEAIADIVIQDTAESGESPNYTCVVDHDMFWKAVEENEVMK